MHLEPYDGNGFPQNMRAARQVARPKEDLPLTNDPVLIAYVVKSRPGKKARWLRIGVAFPHDKGADLTVVLNALPLNFDGRIVLVEPRIDRSEFPPLMLPATPG